MKKISQLLFCLVLPFCAFGQEKKDTSSIIKKKSWDVGIFISGGLNSSQYDSHIFPKYLYDKTGEGSPAITYPNYTVTSGSAEPSKFSDTKLSSSLVLREGFKVSSGVKKNLHHIIEISSVRLNGNFSCSVYYRESVPNYPIYWTEIRDSVNAHYTQSIISFGYKFQPSFEYVFLSIGINCSINNINLSQQIKRQQDDWSIDDTHGLVVRSKSSVRDTTIATHFINLPMEFGFGAYLQIKCLVFKPGLYFTPCLSRGYSFYKALLDLLLNFSRK